MTVLVLGLLIFLGSHSVRMVADPWRTAQIARLGPRRWKGLYTLVSIAGLALVVWGYGLASADPVMAWTAPVWGRHVAALLTIPAFVLIAAAYVPRNRIKAALGHPMLAGVQACRPGPWGTFLPTEHSRQWCCLARSWRGRWRTSCQRAGGTGKQEPATRPGHLRAMRWWRSSGWQAGCCSDSCFTNG